MATEAQIQDALVGISQAIYEAIDMSPNGIPSGHLYAMLMSHMSLDTYNQIIGAMKKAGKIKETNYLLEVVK